MNWIWYSLHHRTQVHDIVCLEMLLSDPLILHQCIPRCLIKIYEHSMCFRVLRVCLAGREQSPLARTQRVKVFGVIQALVWGPVPQTNFQVTNAGLTLTLWAYSSAIDVLGKLYLSAKFSAPKEHFYSCSQWHHMSVPQDATDLIWSFVSTFYT